MSLRQGIVLGQNVVSGIPPGSDQVLAADNNFKALEQYKVEWQYNRFGSTDTPPQIGLALSGGGMRSGVFSMGVLSALDKLGVLPKLDVISSVSGGGYAASWYYIQNSDHVVDPGELFKPGGIYQNYIESHGELVGAAPATDKWLRWTWYALVDAPLVIGSMPVNAIENGFFGWHANTSIMRHLYQHGIERTYQSVPSHRGNSTSFQIKPLSFQEMNTAVALNHLPFFIVNTTAHIEDAPSEDKQYPNEDANWLRYHVFEFTPLRCGSDFFGYRPEFPFNYNRAISVSGAAWDSREQMRESTKRLLFSAANVDLGYFINNPTKNITATGRFFRRLLPLPFYVFSGHYQRDLHGDRVQLADGGHAENLAAYSLIRRFCRHIIIVDSGYDPSYTFDDYRRLKRDLAAEMHVNLSVPEIDSGLPPNQFDPSHPIMIGSISSFPTCGMHHLPDPLEIKIVFIKLSMDVKNLGQYSCAVKTYYQSTIPNYQFNETSVFPQESTLDQSYGAGQITAYRELAQFMIEKDAPKIIKALEIAGH